VVSGLAAQDLQQTRKLADQFYAQGNFEQASMCYQRVAFFSRPEADPVILSRIAGCFYELGDFNRAMEYFDHAYFASNDFDQQAEFLFQKTATLLETGNYHFALVELLGHDFEPKSTLHFRKQLYLGSAYFGLEQYEKAGEYFEKSIPEDATDARRAIQQLYDNPKKFRKPYPKLALYMSAILPGSGQLYAGDLGGGLNSFLLTGTLVGSYFLLVNALHPVDAILTILPWFQRYYQGGFDQAEAIAINKREQNRNQIFQETLDIIDRYYQ